MRSFPFFAAAMRSKEIVLASRYYRMQSHVTELLSDTVHFALMRPPQFLGYGCARSRSCGPGWTEKKYVLAQFFFTSLVRIHEGIILDSCTKSTSFMALAPVECCANVDFNVARLVFGMDAGIPTVTCWHQRSPQYTQWLSGYPCDLACLLCCSPRAEFKYCSSGQFSFSCLPTGNPRLFLTSMSQHGSLAQHYSRFDDECLNIRLLTVNTRSSSNYSVPLTSPCQELKDLT
ncbi:hypothetical protein C8R43DRAFT_1208967 [Mycena crocata]|nr:hypothetical protein C8R43DRAFT_1208967 [Mycena crocata]